MQAVNHPEQPSTHARAARRAVKQLVAAKKRGDDKTAAVYARLAAEAVDRHLAQLRAMLP